MSARRLIGWRVRWEAVGALGEWTACKGGLNALPDACRVARNYRWAPCTRNVRVLRVYRRSKR